MRKFLFKPNVRNIEEVLKITRKDTCYIVANANLSTNYKRYNPIADLRSEEQIIEELEAKELEKELRKL